jgi:type IV pilus assembly protein PilQ
MKLIANHLAIVVVFIAFFVASMAFGEKAPSTSTAAASALEQKPVDLEQQVMSPLDVKDADIQDVIRTISKGYNLNIILDKEVTGKVTVHLSSVPVIEGLKTLARSNGLELIKEGSVYRIRKAIDEERSSISFFKGKLSVDVQNVDVKDLLKDISAKSATSIVPDSKVQGKITGKLFQVDLDDGLRALLEGNGFQIAKRKNIYEVSMGPDAASTSASPSPAGMNRYGGSYRSSGPAGFYVDFTNGKLTLDVSNGNLQDVIKAIAEKSDMQIITYGNIMGEINAKLKDIPLTQALALLLGGTMFTFVQKDSIILIGDRNAATPAGQALSKSELIQLKCIKADGVLQVLPKDIAPSNVRVIKEQNALLVSGTSEDIVSMREFVTIIDVPTPQVAINAIIVEYSEDLQKEFGVNAALHRPDLQDQGTHSSPSFSSNLGAAASNLDLGFSGAGLKKILNDIGGIFSSGSNTIIGRLPDDFYAALHFLETQNKAKVMAQPSIVTLNGNKASINVDQTQYFKLTTGNPLGTDYSIQFKPITFGIKLEITPWISQGGQITAEIAPEVSNSDGANSDGYPNVSSRTLSTTVRLNDGETITLGGLIKNTESESHNKIPILGDIPLLGALFRTNTKSIQKTNLIVYVTPHIIKKDAHLDLDSALQSLDINNADFLERKARELFHKNGPKAYRAASPSDSAHMGPAKAVQPTKDSVSSKSPAAEQPEHSIDKNSSASAPTSDAMLKRYAAPKDTVRSQSPATLKNAPAESGPQTKQLKSLNDTSEIAH